MISPALLEAVASPPSAPISTWAAVAARGYDEDQFRYDHAVLRSYGPKLEINGAKRRLTRLPYETTADFEERCEKVYRATRFAHRHGLYGAPCVRDEDVPAALYRFFVELHPYCKGAPPVEWVRLQLQEAWVAQARPAMMAAIAETRRRLDKPAAFEALRLLQ